MSEFFTPRLKGRGRLRLPMVESGAQALRHDVEVGEMMGVVTDPSNGQRYSIYRANCGAGCACDARAVEVSEEQAEDDDNSLELGDFTILDVNATDQLLMVDVGVGRNGSLVSIEAKADRFVIEVTNTRGAVIRLIEVLHSEVLEVAA